MVGERGFEPPTPWSRTRFSDLLKSVEIERFKLYLIECVAANLLKVCGSALLLEALTATISTTLQRTSVASLGGIISAPSAANSILSASHFMRG